MATVTNTIKLPDGSTPTNAAVEIELVASATGRAAGWVTATDATLLSVARPTVTAGAWTASLTPNADITPSGTVYKITEYADRHRYVHYITVGSGGGSVFDLLTDPPASVASAALSSHLSDSAGAHAATAVSYAAAGAATVDEVQGALRGAVWLNVALYGAVLDGSSHLLSSRFGTLAAAQAVYPNVSSLTEEIDTVAFEAAIEDAANLTGNGQQAVVYHPGGTAISTGIHLKYDDVWLVGGPSATIKLKAGLANTVDVVTIKKDDLSTISRVAVIGLTLDGNKSSYAGGGDGENEIINGTKCHDLLVMNCRLQNGVTDGIDIDGNSDRIRILNNHFESIDRNGCHIYAPNDGLVMGNTFSDVGNGWTTASSQAHSAAIDAIVDGDSGVPGTGYRIVNNAMRNVITGIKCNANRSVIAGNYIHTTNGASGSSVSGCGILVESGASDCLISGNYIYSAALDGIRAGSCTIIGNRVDTAGQYGIHSNTPATVTEALVSGNRIRSTTSHGVYCTARTIVVGNTVAAAGGRGIYLTSASSQANHNYLTSTTGVAVEVAAADCQVNDNQVVGGSNFGIYLNASADCQVVGNRVSGTTDHGIATTGTANRAHICGNHVTGVTATNKAGIQLNANSGGFVQGNKCYGNYWGAVVAASTSDFTVVDNDLTGNSNSDLFVSGSVGSGGVIARNRAADGYLTAASGTGTITAAATSVAVTHGLGATPSAQQITVTPTSTWGSTTKIWVSATTSTTFTVSVDIAPGASLTFGWSADLAR